MSSPQNNGVLLNADVGVPFSEEAEKAVLGSIMIAPEAFIEVSGILSDSDDFYLIRHRVIYQAMETIQKRDDDMDYIVLADCLEASGDLDNMGGRSYLIELANSVGTSKHASVYATLVKRTAIRRRMMQATSDMHSLIQDETLDIDELRDRADSKWLNATSDITEHRGAWMSEAASKFFDELGRSMVGQSITGLETGLHDVDKLLCGLSPEQLIILAGRPGMGKSAAVDNIALHIAKKGIPVFYATSERSIEQVVRRMAAISTGINTVKIQNGTLSPSESSKLTEQTAQFAKLPIYFNDDPMPRPRDIYAQADWMIKRHGCKIILFDGMYRAKTGFDKIDNAESQHGKYGRIALELKTMARALRVPVLATHQLNRSLENRANKRPMMSDLRESGRIEEEADKIIFLYRDVVYNPATASPNGCDWILAKHRDGPTGFASTYFEDFCTRFSNTVIQNIE